MSRQPEDEKREAQALEKYENSYAKGGYSGHGPPIQAGSLPREDSADLASMCRSWPKQSARDKVAGGAAKGRLTRTDSEAASGGASSSTFDGAAADVGEPDIDMFDGGHVDGGELDGEQAEDSVPDQTKQFDCYIDQVAFCMKIAANDMLPTLHVSQKCAFDVVACALPKQRQRRDGKSELNMSQFCVAGFGGITDEQGVQVFVPFCNCSAESLRAFNALESQHWCSHTPGVCLSVSVSVSVSLSLPLSLPLSLSQSL